MKTEIIALVGLGGLLLSSCTSPHSGKGLTRGVSHMRVETSNGDYFAAYNEWRTSETSEAGVKLVGIGLIKTENFKGDWAVDSPSGFEDSKVNVRIMDEEGSTRQKFAADAGAIFLIDTVVSKPTVLATDWSSSGLGDQESLRNYTKELIEKGRQ